MKTNKAMNSYIKNMTKEIKKWNKELTGHYELPPIPLLIVSIKVSEGGCVKIYFDSVDWFLLKMINLMIIYRLTMDEFEKVILDYKTFSKSGIKGKQFISIYYEDNKFVLRLGTDPIEENAINIKMTESLISTY